MIAVFAAAEHNTVNDMREDGGRQPAERVPMCNGGYINGKAVYASDSFFYTCSQSDRMHAHDATAALTVVNRHNDIANLAAL